MAYLTFLGNILHIYLLKGFFDCPFINEYCNLIYQSNNKVILRHDIFQYSEKEQL